MAILNRGAAHNLWWLLAQLGEPAIRIEPDFDPAATAAQYPVLLIPSGGLYGGANPKSRCPNPTAPASIAIVTLSADGAPVWSLVIGHWSLVIGHWSLIPPACPACITA